jgi:peptidoglycan/LPS O-acetylase OafA/YrhL
MGNQNIKKYDYIDALRGIAIILVVLVHSSQYVKPISDLMVRVMGEGARGVQLFYVASAITLCMSWNARRRMDLHPIRDFYLRRFFRIAPLFYLAIILFVLLNGTAASYFAPNGISWWFVPVTALFLHGFHPEIINSVVPGGWSIAVEMTFYLVFPLLARLHKLHHLLLLLGVTIFLQRFNAPISSLIFHYDESQKYLIDRFVFFNFFGQLPVFIMGIIAYSFLAKEKPFTVKLALLGGSVFVVLFVEFWYPRQSYVDSHVVAGALFALFSVFLACRPTVFLVNKLTVLLGKLSFSMYLIHIAVLKLLGNAKIPVFFGDGNIMSIVFFVFVVAITVVVSWFTYRYIEKPGIAVGRKLIDRIEGRPTVESLPSQCRM